MAPETDAFFHRCGAHPSRPQLAAWEVNDDRTGAHYNFAKPQPTVGIKLSQLMHTITLKKPNKSANAGAHFTLQGSNHNNGQLLSSASAHMITWEGAHHMPPHTLPPHAYPQILLLAAIMRI